MELHQALKHIIKAEGQDIVTDLRLVNILNDLNAYQDIQGSKYILRAIIADGFAQKLLHIGSWNNDAINLASRFASNTGFMPESVEVLFKSLAFGLGWVNQLPKTTNANSAPKTQPATSTSLVKNKKTWSKLNVEEREEWLNSLVEIKKILVRFNL